jgi:hypothetical protein
MENKTFMVSQLDNVSLPCNGNKDGKNDGMEKQNVYGLTAGQCELPVRDYGEEKNTTMERKQKPIWSHSWTM